MTSKRKKLLEKIINIFLNILICLFGIILLVIIYERIQVSILKNDYSSFFGYSTFEVLTGSMEDALSPGDMVVVKNTSDIKLNDIITFKKDNNYITHRVIEIKGETYVTKGDANNTDDGEIVKSQVAGKVVKVFPKLGIIKRVLFNPYVLIALIITLYLISSLFRRGKKMKIKEFILKVIDLVKEKLENSSEKEVKKEEPIVLKEQKENIINDEVLINEVPKKVVEEDDFDLTNDARAVLENSSPEDLDKTIFFRMVKVDAEDLQGDVPIKEENEEIEEVEVKEKKEKGKKEQKEEEIIDDVDEEVESKLKLLQKRRKKCKNIIEKVMILKSEELEEIIRELNLNQEYKTNEPTIKDYFLKIYMDAVYYNYCGNVSVDYNNRNMTSKIEDLMIETGNYLQKNYHGKDLKFNDKVNKFTLIFTFLPTLLKISKTTELRARRETLKKKIYQTFKKEYLSEDLANKVANNIIKIQKVYESTLKYIYDKLETNTFKIKYTKLKDQKIYGVDLDHNINFSKVYSNYIVDKTYQEGIVAEDKAFVLANMLLTEMSQDMLNSDFSKKYLLYVPDSLYAKDVKLDQLFNVLNDEYAKYAVLILLKYSEIDGNKTIIKSLIKEGYQFAISIDKDDVLKEKDMKFLYLMTNIVINDKKENSKVAKALPKDLNSKFIFDDVASKIIKNGGEK